jgi:F0F1-type ATP synthase membrane subunit b/b'
MIEVNAWLEAHPWLGTIIVFVSVYWLVNILFAPFILGGLESRVRDLEEAERKRQGAARSQEDAIGRRR